MSKSFFSAKSTSILNLFTSGAFYIIPHYQRGYAWGQEQINQLIEDFLEAIDVRSEIYFTGPITLIKVKEGIDSTGGDYTVYDLVDGQQRLTTFSLLTKILLEHLPLDEDENIDKHRLQKVRHALQVILGITHPDVALSEIGKMPYPIVHRRHSDFEAYKKIMEDGDTSQSKISDAYSALLKRIEELSPEITLEFAEFFLNKVHLIKIETQNEDISYQIFETLNNRGEMLTPLDLIRNRLFRSIYESSHKKLDRAYDLWNDRFSKIEGFFDSRSVDKNLQQIMVMVLNILQRDWIEVKDLYKKLKLELQKQQDPYQLLEQLLDEKAIKACMEICKGRRSTSNVSKSLYIEQASQFLILHPLLYVLFMKNAHESIIRDVARITSNYIKRVQLTTGRVPPVKKTGEVMAELAAEWNDDTVTLHKNDHSKIINRLLEILQEADTSPDKINRNIFDDSAFRQAIASRPNIDEKHAKQALIDIVNSQRDSDGQRMEKSDDLHLEHIFPQKPKLEQWSEFEEEHFFTHLRRLGNLTLLGEKLNETASNKPYEDKKKIYGQSSILITKELPNKWRVWTPHTIEEREQELLDQLAKVWSLSPKP